MILVRLSGGLGNQMFQYAAGRALADRLGAELALDTRALDKALARNPYTPRPYALAAFNLRARLAQPTELVSWPQWATEIGLRLRFLRPWFGRWYFENGTYYDPKLHLVSDPVCLVGYWQSERYFDHINERVRADFTLREFLSGANAEMLERARSSDSVGLHVRRGDFVNLKDAAKVHGLCSLSYYQRAITLILESCPQAHFLVFSDDPGWARTELHINAPVVYVTGNQESPEKDLILMRACKHHVIANSSFSWWAAWLGYSPEQMVIAPTPWYASPKFDARDLAVASWRYIDRV